MFERITQYIPALLDGALTTLTLSFTAILIGFFGGVILYLLRRTKISPIVFLVEVYVSFFRGTPMLVQLLMLFYVPPALGLDLNPYIAAISALGLNSAAYQSEILRAGLVIPPFLTVHLGRICYMCLVNFLFWVDTANGHIRPFVVVYP